MGRVVPLRPAREGSDRPARQGHHPWDTSLTIMEGAQRRGEGIAHCQGRLLLRKLGDGDWEITFLDGRQGTTRAMRDISHMSASDVLEEIHNLMFRG